MIDKVKLYKRIDLDTNKFDKRIFKCQKYNYNIKDNEEGERYICNKKFVFIKYNPSSSILVVEGRFLNLSEMKNKVDTLGELWKGKRGIIGREKTTTLSNSEMYDQSFYMQNKDGEDVLMFPEMYKEEISIYNPKSDITQISTVERI